MGEFFGDTLHIGETFAEWLSTQITSQLVTPTASEIKGHFGFFFQGLKSWMGILGKEGVEVVPKPKWCSPFTYTPPVAVFGGPPVDTSDLSSDGTDGAAPAVVVGGPAAGGAAGP